MFKNLKKYSKLLLATLLSVSVPFSSYAVKSHRSTKSTATDIKSAQTEKIKLKKKPNFDLSKKYDVDGLIPIEFHIDTKDRSQWTKCEIVQENHPCNHLVKYYYFIPDKTCALNKIGRSCLKRICPKAKRNSVIKPVHKKIYLTAPTDTRNPIELLHQIIASSKIFNYFFSQKWKINPSDNSFVIDLSGLLKSPDIKDRILKKDNFLVVFSEKNLSEDNPNTYGIWYDADLTRYNKSSEKNTTLSDDKIFEAYNFFCEKNLIYQPFRFKK